MAGKGVVVVAGIFPPGSVVRLNEADGEHQLVPGVATEVERRLVDDNGNVGFDGLEVGGRYFASGYVDGYPVDVRATATDVEAPDSELAQPPIGNEPEVIGTQEEKVEAEPPAPPAEDLPVGVPEGVELPPGAAPEEAPPEAAPAEPTAPDSAPASSPDSAPEAASSPAEPAPSSPADAPADAAPAEAPPAGPPAEVTVETPASEPPTAPAAEPTSETEGVIAPPPLAAPVLPDAPPADAAPAPAVEAAVPPAEPPPEPTKPLYAFTGDPASIDATLWTQTTQATADGQPLYEFRDDLPGGAPNGVVPGVWTVAAPTSSEPAPAAPAEAPAEQPAAAPEADAATQPPAV